MINAVRASEIASLLDHAPRGVEILSLDCFDTLIWRNANVPVDVFAHLPIEGGGMENRIWAEKKARKALSLYESRPEVSIAEIYARMFGEAIEAQIAQAVEAEIAAEARHCFAFAPVRELIADAKRRGLKVIIVSDTYLQEPQLRGLIAAAAGQDVADQIDRIFCSCQYGVSKAGGMFMHVLADLGISPAKIVHLGDNREADYVAAQKFGIHGVHFEQFDGVAEQRLRLEAAASKIGRAHV